MPSFRNLKGFAAAAALVVAVGFAGTPAWAVVSSNALAPNSLTNNSLMNNSLIYNSPMYNSLAAVGSAIGDLNGVAVEAVTLP